MHWPTPKVELPSRPSLTNEFLQNIGSGDRARWLEIVRIHATGGVNDDKNMAQHASLHCRQSQICPSCCVASPRRLGYEAAISVLGKRLPRTFV